jgi:uncharacterized membrane protein
MTLSITVGGILRAINTVGAAHSFATGSFIMGTVLAGLVVGSIIIEEVEFEK